MDLTNNKAFIVGVSLRDIEHPPSSPHLSVDVVILDNSNEVLNPLLYQLNKTPPALEDEQRAYYQSGVFHLENNAFALVGEVLSIDKNKRLIELTDNKTVSYKYLVIASGLKQTVLGSTHDEDLSGGIHALIEALRIRRNISERFTHLLLDQLGFNKNHKHHQASVGPLQNHPIKNIQKIVGPLNYPEIEKSLDMSLSRMERRLYQVQL